MLGARATLHDETRPNVTAGPPRVKRVRTIRVQHTDWKDPVYRAQMLEETRAWASTPGVYSVAYIRIVGDGAARTIATFKGYP